MMDAADEFKIEKNVPLPDSKGGVKKYPFGEMDIGDSFHIESALLVRVRSAVSWFGQRHKKKFSLRKDGDGYRVWRVA